MANTYCFSCRWTRPLMLCRVALMSTVSLTVTLEAASRPFLTKLTASPSWPLSIAAWAACKPRQHSSAIHLFTQCLSTQPKWQGCLRYDINLHRCPPVHISTIITSTCSQSLFIYKSKTLYLKAERCRIIWTVGCTSQQWQASCHEASSAMSIRAVPGCASCSSATCHKQKLLSSLNGMLNSES